MSGFWIISAIMAILSILCFGYQFYYLLISLFRPSKQFKEGGRNRFAVLIAARNEENVIGNLIDSIKAQTYSQELIDVYVVADNCTDATAEVSRKHGATVFTRFSEKKGKGYALDFLLQKIRERYGFDVYDGYFVFDADNLLDPHFIEEMNRVFSADYKIVTGYRNSKNFGASWVSFGYAIWFLREARYLNKPRMLLNTSCTISGTGFLMHRDIVKKYNGWRQHLLVEDIQFSAENILDGEIIGYCENAILYDEQPEDFALSWTQRLRWVRGHIQIVGHYGLKLLRGMFSPNFSSCYDFLMNIFPAVVLPLLGIFVGVGQTIYMLVTQKGSLGVALLFVLGALLGSYFFFFSTAALTLLTEWKRIKAAPGRKIAYLFLFPVFMATYLPIAVACVFQKVEWKPIRHTVAVTLNDIEHK